MKIDSNFKLRSIAGENILVNQGQMSTDMTRIISLNSSAQLLFEQLQEKEFTLDDAAQVLMDTYHIDKEQAQKDATAWVEALKGCKIIR